MRQKLDVSWKPPSTDTKLRQFKRYLRDKGARQSTIDDYLFRVEKYFQFCGSEVPRLKWPKGIEIIYSTAIYPIHLWPITPMQLGTSIRCKVKK
jgi:hypothetical protein